MLGHRISYERIGYIVSGRENGIIIFIFWLLRNNNFANSPPIQGWASRATRPRRPADVSALPRRHAAYGPPLNGSAHGRKVLHAFRPTRTLPGGI